MDILKKVFAVFSWLGMVFGGMFGGQKEKGARRFGLPAIATSFAIGWNGFQWKDLAYLLFIPVLCMGYGVDSVIGAMGFHIEWLIRVVYALLLSIPFIFSGLTRWVISAIILILAFQVRAGSLGNIPWFGDILIEDICRYGALATLVLLNTMIRRK